jgi:hypothetical protein
MTNQTPSVADVLASHQATWVAFQQRPVLCCTCGDGLLLPTSSAVATLKDHAAHVAEQVESLIAAREQAAVVRALREAADMSTPGPAIRRALLRDRADRIEGGDQDAAVEDGMDPEQSGPCHRLVRCADRTLCPPACQEAGGREDQPDPKPATAGATRPRLECNCIGGPHGGYTCEGCR